MKNLIDSNNHNLLWPTISDAIDTYLRRKNCSADNYERVWRLIHIWEAIEITLAAAALAKYKEKNEDSDTYTKCKEYFYGCSWDSVAKSLSNFLGACNGSIDQWINILNEVAKDKSTDSIFLKSLSRFLNSNEIKIQNLFAWWNRCCDVPSGLKKEKEIKTIVAMRQINSFRNRFAHVPFPHDPLEGLADSLEDVTEQLFSINPLPSKHIVGGQSSPLTGCFYEGKTCLIGNIAICSSETECSIDLTFKFPAKEATGITSEEWSTHKLAYVDSMKRPHILTRVKDEQGTVEYTRFRAEANAVIIRSHEEDSIIEIIKPPKETDYAEQEDDSSEDNSNGITQSQAIEAIKKEDFDTAITYFRELTITSPIYHTAWLRLGYALREKAVRLENGQEANDLLLESIESFTKATEHINDSHKATAFYERSKAYLHLARRSFSDYNQLEMIPKNSNLEKAEEDALKAFELSPYPKYESWLEYLFEFEERIA